VTRKKKSVEGSLSMSVNGHALTGQRVGGKWKFSCPSWPDLAEKHAGAAGTADVVGDFMARVLAGATWVKGHFESMTEETSP
jgi:hypothetical protein